jgi:hypothetical protein
MSASGAAAVRDEPHVLLQIIRLSVPAKMHAQLVVRAVVAGELPASLVISVPAGNRQHVVRRNLGRFKESYFKSIVSFVI